MKFTDIIYEKKDAVGWIIINREKAMNAFRTETMKDMCLALEDADLDGSIGVVVITGAGDKAFCVGGDKEEASSKTAWGPGMDYWHTRIISAIRVIPKPVIAAVNGWCLGGGNIVHMTCDLSIASDRAKFGQVGPKLGSFDAGIGGPYLARLVGVRKAKEIWFLCKQYTAQEAVEMGLVNKVVPHDQLRAETEKWCEEMLKMGPTSLKFMKYGINADTDSILGMVNMGMAGVRLYWGSEEANEWKQAFWQKKAPNSKKFRK